MCRATWDRQLKPVRLNSNYMGDIDHDNQIEQTTNEAHGAPSITVAQETCVDDNGDHGENSVRKRNFGGWTENEKTRITQIDIDERQKGPGFMKRIKERWDAEFPSRRHITAQNLCDNARRFRKNLEMQAVPQVASDSRESSTKEKNLQWTTEMKVKLVEIDTEERRNGRGFMSRVKGRWDVEYPTYAAMMGAQRLRDNASRFRKEKEISNLVLVRKRSPVGRVEEELEPCRTGECSGRDQGENANGEEVHISEEVIEGIQDGVEDLQAGGEMK